MKTVVCIFVSLFTGIGASYLLVVEGLKVPAGILGILGIVTLCVFIRRIDSDAQDFWEWLLIWGDDDNDEHR